MTIDQADVVGGRGWPLVAARDPAQPTVEVKIEAEVGRPVKGKDGIIGWMTDYGAVSKKVGDIVLLIHNLNIFHFLGIHISARCLVFTRGSCAYVSRHSDGRH